MSDFKAKMHKIRFPLGPLQTPYLFLTRPTFKGRAGKRRMGRRMGEREGEKKRRGSEGKGRIKPPIFWPRTAPIP